MEVNCVIIELKPDSLGLVEEWSRHILLNKDEAISTLQNEGVTIETFFLAKIEDKDYLVAYMRAKSMEKAIEAVKESISEIDAYHQQFKRDVWVKGMQSKLVLDLSRISNEEQSA